LAESGPLIKLIFPFAAGGGGKTLCRIPAQHRDLVIRGRIPGVLQHVRGRALDPTRVLSTSRGCVANGTSPVQ
jgi:hypothetical protein